ncbi:DNA-(apurinic or apyrimidinic site) lyase [Jatrophihabitans sp. GAS493]|uniref:bifunctional DNA-formamidopyrimidine glycosylase/DNA-(apurinic or apyrimidinic site) lyase n=1 Tax=Jatrophihabitans sp. GAS493 TaxID=1907575 RepID=UPI000BB93373|nr:bifunctional DNA-formamidopyrimidine glycosylase/DNA-(apurinic or apyrimidinic site) lyase [Jatrophihabitans sp. GAS493]SOD73435.1 DNA-(apurinic or apyrimidinic site) lyase [Jatrophihabitans sp. GAS493]
MPELPEVETVRAGLERWIVGRTIESVEVSHPRAVRRHLPGAVDFSSRLAGRTVARVRRRGKYLWLELADSDLCVVGHLGMSGQLLIQPPEAPDERHLHVRVRFTDSGSQLRFVDQRTFGGLMLDELRPAVDLAGDTVPGQISHIARDPLDPALDEAALRRRMRARSSAIKRTLLDQSILSGVGNIYADESLWRSRLHPEQLTSRLNAPQFQRLLSDVRDVLNESLVAGGTSFDSLYVNVNGESGYFDRTLNAYGREDEPCRRCGTAIRRVSFMNRSSFFCPACQRTPRRVPGPARG